MRSNIEKLQMGPIGRRVITLSHHASYQLAKWCPNTIPIIFVVGYPKSGTAWACQMVSDCLQLPFADLSLFPIGFPSVMHGHYRVWPDSPSTVYVVRDGRDALVSMYFYHARALPDGGRASSVPRLLRRYFPNGGEYDMVRENMPAFIEAQMHRPTGCRAHWGQHVRSYFDSGRTDVPILKYEDMLSDCPAALTAALTQLTGTTPDPDAVRATVAKYRFERQSGRKPGCEDRSNFLRKGQAGDWRNCFNREAAQLFDQWCGDELIRIGYESDRAWVNEVC